MVKCQKCGEELLNLKTGRYVCTNIHCNDYSQPLSEDDLFGKMREEKNREQDKNKPIGQKIVEGAKEKVTTYKEGKVEQAKALPGKAVGRAEQAVTSATNTFGDGVKFVIGTVLLLVVTLNNFIPTVQGWTGIELIKTTGAYYSFVIANVWVLTGICTVVSFVLAIMLGLIGKSPLKGVYQFELIFVTMEVLVLLSGSWFLPWICGANPDFCRSTKCIAAWIKQGYSLENAQRKCAGEQELKVTKENEQWETLDLIVGSLETPKGGQTEDYTFKFSLINQNMESSKYFINVTAISTVVSSKSDFSGNEVISKKDPDPPLPPYSIPPTDPNCQKMCGQPIEFTFNRLPECSDEKQFFFKTIVTTKQAGGGSGDIKLIDKASTEVFEPNIYTNPGPVDMYVYTYPYLLEFDKLKETFTDSNGVKYNFKFWITIKNKCDKINNPGRAEITDLTVIYPTRDIPINISCPGYSKSTCTEKMKGIEGTECFKISPSKPLILECNQYSGEEVTKEIKCYGKFTSKTFIGEKTSQASVLSDYKYIQNFTIPPLGAECENKEGSST